MGHHVDKKERDRADRYELGSVDNVHDLEPEYGVGPTRAAKAQERIANPDSSGYFELQGGSHGQLGTPLQLSDAFKEDGGSKIVGYVAGYNTYAAPLRSTLRAMGRLKDISLTGAPLTPAELMKRPDVAGRFARLSPDRMTVQDNQAFDVWSAQQTRMRNDILRYGAGQHELAGIIANYQRVQARLESRRTEWERTKTEGELREITEAADTLAQVVGASVGISLGILVVEEALEAHVAFNENAEGLGSIDGLPQSNNPDWQHGTVDDPTGETVSTKGKLQQVTGGGRDAAGPSKPRNEKAREDLLFQAKEALDKTGKVELSLEGMFIAANGNAGTYAALEQNIQKLNNKLAKLELAQERSDVESASQELLGFKTEFAARTLDIRSDRTAARRGARTFSQSIGAGPAGLSAMSAAEAYEELASFGSMAVEQRRGFVDPLWRPVHDYLYSTDAHRFAVIGARDDAATLALNLRAVQEQKAYFQIHVPDWHRLASDWRSFLQEHTGSNLIAASNEADRLSEAP